MSLNINPQEFRLLRDLIREECGIFLGDEKAYLVVNRLGSLVRRCNCSTFGEFYLRAKSSPDARQLRALMIDAITTNETSWFRDKTPFKIFREYLLPEFYRQVEAGERRYINILSAGCSTGQEPYSIAMTVLDFFDRVGGAAACHARVKILATDISASSLEVALAGRYDNASIGRGLPAICLEQHFHQVDGRWAIGDRVRRMVTFKRCNLKEPRSLSGPFDLIFMRNVIIYFDDKFKRELLARIARLLEPAGYLFLGTGETVSGYTEAFDILEHERGLFYRVKAGSVRV